MPVAIIAWMNIVQGLLAAAPDIIAFGAKVKTWIADLFSSGLITAADQNALNERVTEICRASLTGALPPEWTVEADPS